MRSRNRSVTFGEKSLSIALFFILLVALLVGLSIALKIFLLFKAAKFDGEHQFILELHTPSQKQLLSFSPDTNTISVLSLKDTPPMSFGKFLGIPEDGVVTLSEPSDSMYVLAQNLLFHPPSHLPLNVIDRLRLFLFVNNLKPTNISESTWAKEEQDDKKLSQLFTDHTAYTENLSISLINASGVSGLGNKAAQELSHIGLNVISVTSSQDSKEKSNIVYSGKEGYTTKRLMHILKIEAFPSPSAMVSDITVTLGKDAANIF